MRGGAKWERWEGERGEVDVCGGGEIGVRVGSNGSWSGEDGVRGRGRVTGVHHEVMG